ncbi:hypothetical protein D3C72_2214600 [compost metagenome]
MSTTVWLCMSSLLMVLATRLLTNRWRPSPVARKACAPLSVLMVLTSLGCAPATSNTCTPSPPVSATNTNLLSGLPYRSAGMGPVLMRHFSVWLAISMATSSSLSCMDT